MSTRSGAEARAASLSTRSIKTTAKAYAIDLAIRMVDLTTLEGQDTPGKVRTLCAKAMRPDPTDPGCPSTAAICVYPDMVPIAKQALGQRRQHRRGRHRVPQRPGRDGHQARRHQGRRRGGCRRDRHGHRPRRVPDRPATCRSSRRSPRSARRVPGPTGRGAPQGDHGDRRAPDLRQRPQGVLALHARRRPLHQDLDRQGAAGRDAAGDADHAGGGPRLPRGYRSRWSA